VSWAWWDWPVTWLTNHCPSVLWHCWLGHVTRKTVSEMTYNVSCGTLNSTIPTIPTVLPFLLRFLVPQALAHSDSCMFCSHLSQLFNHLRVQRIIVPRQIIWIWCTGRWWVGCCIWYSEEGTGQDGALSSPLFPVPNVTAHPLYCCMMVCCSAVLMCP